MIQQMINPKPNEYGLANTQTSLPNCDKQQPALIKKTALRDLQNDNRSAVPKPLGISHFLKEIGRITDTIKVSGNKRQTPECPSSPGHQSPSNNNANGHLLYTRRKSNSELGKNSTCEITESVVDCPPMRQLSHGELGTPHQQMSMKEHKNSCFAAYAPIPMASLMTFSSGGPTVSLSMGKNNNGLSPAESNYPTISSGVPFLGSPETSNQHWKERFLRLQAYLRTCDHSSQEEYIQMLRSLSSVGRNKHAVDLEKRAIHLLLEEGKELHRMKVLNVLGKSAQKNNVSPTMQQVQLEK